MTTIAGLLLLVVGVASVLLSLLLLVGARRKAETVVGVFAFLASLAVLIPAVVLLLP